jgi:hypothetical protein
MAEAPAQRFGPLRALGGEVRVGPIVAGRNRVAIGVPKQDGRWTQSREGVNRSDDPLR